jgi:hypothetical protein
MLPCARKERRNLPRPAHAILSLLALLLLLGPAEGRELTRGERAYARTLGKLLELKPTKPRGLTSRSGAKGLQVGFLGLSVSRLHFSSKQAARKFARKRSREKNPRQRISLRKQEVLILRGTRLSNAAFARRAVSAAWKASANSPSVKGSSEGLLGPIAAKKEAKEAAPKPTEATKAGRADEPIPSPPPAKKPPPVEVIKIEFEHKVGDLGRVVQRGPARPSKSRVAKRIVRPDGLDLTGRWGNLGRGRINFRFTGQTKTSDSYEVLFMDFDRSTAPLVGVLTGRRLTLQAASGKGAIVTFVWRPSGAGGRFVRVGSPRGVLPRNTGTFWRSVSLAPKK